MSKITTSLLTLNLDTFLACSKNFGKSQPQRSYKRKRYYYAALHVV